VLQTLPVTLYFVRQLHLVTKRGYGAPHYVFLSRFVLIYPPEVQLFVPELYTSTTTVIVLLLLGKAMFQSHKVYRQHYSLT
jgi:hypothetical protein